MYLNCGLFTSNTLAPKACFTCNCWCYSRIFLFLGAQSQAGCLDPSAVPTCLFAASLLWLLWKTLSQWQSSSSGHPRSWLEQCTDCIRPARRIQRSTAPLYQLVAPQQSDQQQTGILLTRGHCTTKYQPLIHTVTCAGRSWSTPTTKTDNKDTLF